MRVPATVRATGDFRGGGFLEAAARLFRFTVPFARIGLEEIP
jgi:hypothetical protein